MARVVRLNIGTPVERLHPTEVVGEVRVVETIGGERLLQISTFGSKDRQSEPKVSQTLQFDRGMANRLKVLIEETFVSDD